MTVKMRTTSSPARIAFPFLLLVLSVSWAHSNPLVAMPGHIAPKDRICFALYTVHEKTLKLTAQFYPIKDFEPFEAELQVRDAGQWVQVATADIVYPGYTATFRVEALT